MDVSSQDRPNPRLRLLARVLLVFVPLSAAHLGCSLLVRDALSASWHSLHAEPATLDALVCLVAAAVSAICLAWLTLVAVLTAGATVPGRLGEALGDLAARITPAAMRRLGAGLLGAAVAIPPHVAGAAAAPVGVEPATVSAGRHPAERPAAADPPLDRPVAVPASAADRDVVVRRGDSLWRLAGAALPAGGSAADTARAWPRWYAANRSTIGPDPDLIRPGQHLHIPDPPGRPSPSPSEEPS